MLAEPLRPEEYSLIRKDKNLAAFPLPNAVVSRKQSGKVFVKSKSHAKDYFVLHKAGFSLVGSSDDSSFAGVLLKLFETSEHLPNYFHIYDPPHALVTALSSRGDMFNLRIRKRIQLKYLSDSSALPHESQYTTRQVDKTNLQKLTSFGLQIESKFWDSADDFLRDGFGVYLENPDGFPVSICYSACVVDNTAEIDIKTDSSYLNKGLAKMVTHAFLQVAQSRGVTANWDCFEDNVASYKTALKSGFTVTRQYQFVSVFNKLKANDSTGKG